MCFAGIAHCLCGGRTRKKNRVASLNNSQADEGEEEEEEGDVTTAESGYDSKKQLAGRRKISAISFQRRKMIFWLLSSLLPAGVICLLWNSFDLFCLQFSKFLIFFS